MDRFSGGLARVIVKGHGEYIDQNGTVVIEPHFDRAESFADGLRDELFLSSCDRTRG